MLIMEAVTATVPEDGAEAWISCLPAMTMEPTTAMAEMALVRDISGVWSRGETRRMTRSPTKVASTKT